MMSDIKIKMISHEVWQDKHSNKLSFFLSIYFFLWIINQVVWTCKYVFFFFSCWLILFAFARACCTRPIIINSCVIPKAIILWTFCVRGVKRPVKWVTPAKFGKIAILSISIVSKWHEGQYMHANNGHSVTRGKPTEKPERHFHTIVIGYHTHWYRPLPISTGWYPALKVRRACFICFISFCFISWR